MLVYYLVEVVDVGVNVASVNQFRSATAESYGTSNDCLASAKYFSQAQRSDKSYAKQKEES